MVFNLDSVLLELVITIIVNIIIVAGRFFGLQEDS